MFRAALALCLVMYSSLALAADSLTLARNYVASGTGPDGSKYKGEVTIDVTSDTTFAIRWDIGGTLFTGYGMRRNDILTATFTSGKETGLVIYQVQGDGLDGLWTIKGENGHGLEHLVPAQ